MADVIVPAFKAFRADRKLIASLTSQPQLIRYLENLGIDASSTTPDLFAQLLTLIIDAYESAASAQSTATQARQNIDNLRTAIQLFEQPSTNGNEIRRKLDELENLINDLPTFSAADKTKLNTIIAGAGVISVSGTAPVASTGGATPSISISAATPAAAGSLSAADKTKLDSVASGASVASVGATAPITSTGGASPTIGISATPSFSTVTLTNGQLLFPAIQVPSANANTLDDYAEGVWTPTFTCATPGNLAITYSIRAAAFTKIGRQVFANFVLSTSAFTWTTASGAINITGLPFATSAVSQIMGGLDWSGITKAGYTTVNCVLSPATTFLQLVASGSALARIGLNIADFPSGGSVFLSGQISYFV